MKFKVRLTIKRKYIEYFKTNWDAPFVIAFQALLVSAARYLAVGAKSVANELADYAYYSLVAGVILQPVSYIKYEERKSKMPNNNS